MRQTGAAAGAAISGVAANLVGFSDGLTDASARAASVWVFVSVIPLALRRDLGGVPADRVGRGA